MVTSSRPVSPHASSLVEDGDDTASEIIEMVTSLSSRLVSADAEGVINDISSPSSSHPISPPPNEIIGDAALNALAELAVASEPMVEGGVVPAEPVVAAKKRSIRKTPFTPQKTTWLITHGIGGVQITKELIERTLSGVKLSECYTTHDRLLRHTLFRLSEGPGNNNNTDRACFTRDIVFNIHVHRHPHICCYAMSEDNAEKQRCGER